MATRSRRSGRGNDSTSSAAGKASGPSCRHVSGIFSDRAEATIHQPDRWVCSTKDCGTSGGGRLCLTCGLCFCSKHAKQHSAEWQNRGTGHPLSIELNSDDKKVHCYDCNIVVHNDNPKGELFLIRGWIDQVQNLNSGNDTLPYLSKEAQARRGKEDLIRTALHRWRYSLITKCFNSWKDYKRGGSDDDTTDSPSSSPSNDAHISITTNESTALSSPPPVSLTVDVKSTVRRSARNASSTTAPDDTSTTTATGPRVSGRKRGRPPKIAVPSPSPSPSPDHTDNDNVDESDDESDSGSGGTSDSNTNDGDEKEAKRARRSTTPSTNSTTTTTGRRGRRRSAPVTPMTPGTPSAARAEELAEELKRRARSDKDDHSVAVPSEGRPLNGRRRSLISSPGVCGLRNLGNTCYMNSVLQALSNAIYFRRYFAEHFPELKSKKEDAKLELSEGVSTLMNRLWDGKRSFFTPDEMLQTVWKMCRQFMGFKQQDAQEFTLFVLNQLSKEQPLGHLADLPLPYARPTISITEPTSSSSTSSSSSSSTTNNDVAPNATPTRRSNRRKPKDDSELSDIRSTPSTTSSTTNGASSSSSSSSSSAPSKPQIESRPDDFIVQQFGGILRNSVECRRCGHRSNTDTDLLGVLGLQIPPQRPNDDSNATTARTRGRARGGSSTAAATKTGTGKPRGRPKGSTNASTNSTTTSTITAAPSRGSARKGAKKIPPPTFTLKECLDYTYCSAEELNGDNQYHCAKCNGKVDAIKRYSISALPARYLILHLMRTEFDPRTGNPSKNPSRVVFPLRGLDMTSVLHCATSNDINTGNGNSNGSGNGNGDEYIYDLFAAVIHHGRGMNEGHFTAYCYFKEQGKWLLYNDANVTVADVKEVEESQAYLLFYERRHATTAVDELS